jgi:hypothetical protein
MMRVEPYERLDETGVTSLISVTFTDGTHEFVVRLNVDGAWELAAQLMLLAGRLDPAKVEL